jgi:hypothetical protein
MQGKPFACTSRGSGALVCTGRLVALTCALDCDASAICANRDLFSDTYERGEHVQVSMHGLATRSGSGMTLELVLTGRSCLPDAGAWEQPPFVTSPRTASSTLTITDARRGASWWNGPMAAGLERGGGRVRTACGRREGSRHGICAGCRTAYQGVGGERTGTQSVRGRERSDGRRAARVAEAQGAS